MKQKNRVKVMDNELFENLYCQYCDELDDIGRDERLIGESNYVIYQKIYLEKHKEATRLFVERALNQSTLTD